MKAINLKEIICSAGIATILLLSTFSISWKSRTHYSNLIIDSVTAQFLREALACNRTEIQLALMANRRAQTGEVKALAKNLLKFHGDLNLKLKQLAFELGVQAKDEMSGEWKDDIDKLSRLKGSLFERKYLALSEKNHKEALSLYKHAFENAGDSKARSFASAIIPFFETHNASITLLSKSVKETSKL